MNLNKYEQLMSRRKYTFLPELAEWLVYLYRSGDIGKAKRIARVILKYNTKINYEYIKKYCKEYDGCQIKFPPNIERVLCL